MSMKRLTDERIAALIDMGPLNETIADIKSALIELQERRKANSEPVISIIIKDGWPEENTATPINGAPKLTDGTHELYAAPQPAPIAPDLSGIDMTNTFEDEELEMMSRGNNPRSNAYRELLAFRNAMGSQEFPDLKSEKSSLPVSKFDNEYIRTRLQVFDDTDEIVGWLSDLADEYHEKQNFAEEYNLREAATSLCGMYADLKYFGNELIRLQGNQAPVRQPASNSAAIADLVKIISTAGNDPSEITDAVWAAGYRKPERTEEEAINLAIDTFTDSRYNGIPDDAWPKTYDEILQCELSEIIGEVTWSYFSPENIANCLIEAGYSLENVNEQN